MPNPSSLTLKPLNSALTINSTKYPVKCCSSVSNKSTKNGALRYIKLTTVSQSPIVIICAIIGLLTMLSSLLLGFSRIYFSSAGSLPSMIAPRLSITRLTNSKCVTLSGSSTPKNGAIALTITAVTLITSWNLQNFKILW